MNAQRLFVIVLVVIAVLFVISVAAASSHGNQPADSSSVLSGLKGLRSKPLASFDSHDQATCATNPTTLSVGSAGCTITLDKRGFFARPIRVILRAQGLTGAVVHVQPRGEAARTSSLNPGDCLDTAVSHSGGTITIDPAAGAILTLAEGC